MTEVAAPRAERPSAPRPQSFAARFDPTRNAMALLRIVLASLVIVSHAYPLSGRLVDPIGGVTQARESFGTLAVDSSTRVGTIFASLDRCATKRLPTARSAL